MHIVPLMVIGSLVVRGELEVLLRVLNYPMDGAIKKVQADSGFYMCSPMDSTTPKDGHVSHDAHVKAKSCCAPPGAYKRTCSRPRSVDTTIPRAWRCENVLA